MSMSPVTSPVVPSHVSYKKQVKSNTTPINPNELNQKQGKQGGANIGAIAAITVIIAAVAGLAIAAKKGKLPFMKAKAPETPKGIFNKAKAFLGNLNPLKSKHKVRNGVIGGAVVAATLATRRILRSVTGAGIRGNIARGFNALRTHLSSLRRPPVIPPTP